MKTEKLEALIDKYSTHMVSVTFRCVASVAHLSPSMTQCVEEMTRELEEALADFAGDEPDSLRVKREKRVRRAMRGGP